MLTNKGLKVIGLVSLIIGSFGLGVALFSNFTYNQSDGTVYILKPSPPRFALLANPIEIAGWFLSAASCLRGNHYYMLGDNWENGTNGTMELLDIEFSPDFTSISNSSLITLSPDFNYTSTAFTGLDFDGEHFWTLSASNLFQANSNAWHQNLIEFLPAGIISNRSLPAVSDSDVNFYQYMQFPRTTLHILNNTIVFEERIYRDNGTINQENLTAYSLDALASIWSIKLDTPLFVDVHFDDSGLAWFNGGIPVYNYDNTAFLTFQAISVTGNDVGTVIASVQGDSIHNSTDPRFWVDSLSAFFVNYSLVTPLTYGSGGIRGFYIFDTFPLQLQTSNLTSGILGLFLGAGCIGLAYIDSRHKKAPQVPTPGDAGEE